MMTGTRGFASWKTSSKPTLRWPLGKKPTLFSHFYSPGWRLSESTKSVIADTANPRHQHVKRKFEAKDPNLLSTASSATLATSPKRTVRVWCVRRLRAALREEMEARGLNVQGQRLGSDGKAIEGPPVVSGTFLMTANQKMIAAKYEKVREEVGWAADALVGAFRQSANGRDRETDSRGVKRAFDTERRGTLGQGWPSPAHRGMGRSSPAGMDRSHPAGKGRPSPEFKGRPSPEFKARPSPEFKGRLSSEFKDRRPPAGKGRAPRAGI
ncbi:translation initiation factor if-2-like [Diplodia corticola]|uniref:Translation initiation factor if-2-like n=1 Tax=Diplodia corticola TaxID=236234 RepID=A0A1J9R3V3_9PEZI|nr:translation initiation factor if-2-like [Diplodia corticola]OJD35288.1 translation initiation factor if-2-like [Diplodia corticola]